MRKTILTTTLLFMISLVSLTAQTTVSLGIKTNANLTNVKLTDLKATRGNFKPGASLGLFTRIGFTQNFALQPELVVNYTETKENCYPEKIKLKYGGIELPVYALGQIKAGNGKFFIGAGPHIGYGFSANAEIEKSHTGNSFKNAIELDHWYSGINTLTGYEFDFGLSIHGGYQMSWDLGSRKKRSGIKTETISLGVAYKFQLKSKK